MNKGEVSAPLGLGLPPDWFDEKSRELWARIVDEAPPNVLSVADRLIVEEWVRLTAELVECRSIIRRDGMSIVEDRDGYAVTKAHPLLPTLTQLRKQWVAIADRLGFSASARASLSIESPKEPSVLARFLANGGKASDG